MRKGRPALTGRRSYLPAACAAGIGLLAAMLTYAVVVEPRRIVVERMRVAVPEPARALDGFTLVQLSDLHCGRSRRWTAHLRHAVQITNDLRPDLVVLTGDYADDTSIVRTCATMLADLRAPCGVVAVFGNHDYYGSHSRPHVLADALCDAGIVVLRNDVLEVPARAPLSIVGLDDAYTGHDKVALALSRLPRRRGVRIMLSHYPDAVERLSPGTVDLVLSGHAHGGQIRLPLLAHLVRRHHAHTSYSNGRYLVDGTLLYVNRGLASSFPQARFLSPPEVTHITLVAN